MDAILKISVLKFDYRSPSSKIYISASSIQLGITDLNFQVFLKNVQVLFIVFWTINSVHQPQRESTIIIVITKKSFLSSDKIGICFINRIMQYTCL